MMKIKNKLHLLPFFLISYLGLFFLININPVTAMNNNDDISENNSIVDNHIDEYNDFKNLLLTQGRISKQLINALFNHSSITEINFLLNQIQQVHQQIITYQQRQLNNQEQMLRNFDNIMTRVRLEREYLLLTQEMISAINNTPLYASEEQINILRNIQTRIDQTQRQINIIRNQIQNNQNQPNNPRRN
ncbi:SVM family protein ['Opuntia sp.' phytoplasma]|uniref:SVM family protein n=1 Tax=Candidatus Phytoplasma asiaticum TaxID=2763338 RepID=A0AAX3B8J3_9MOLU|nr:MULTISPECIES: SVM family protein [Phytoplasma]MDO8054252.1 SVM family protein ['Opuntia sp.' phytoplasma]MDO8058061.1 SVM family protein ['Opuntia sp.' phytoplasma]UQV27003.1 SVM family protein ['Parthenium hysterophorus' phyllody phytoplasma]